MNEPENKVYDLVMRMRVEKESFNPNQKIGKMTMFQDGTGLINIEMDKIRFIGEDYGTLKIRAWPKNK